MSSRVCSELLHSSLGFKLDNTTVQVKSEGLRHGAPIIRPAFTPTSWELQIQLVAIMVSLVVMVPIVIGEQMTCNLLCIRQLVKLNRQNASWAVY